MVEFLPGESVKKNIFLGKVKDKNQIDILSKERFVKSYLEKGVEICAFEKPFIPENATENYCLIEMKIFQHSRSYYIFKGV